MPRVLPGLASLKLTASPGAGSAVQGIQLGATKPMANGRPVPSKSRLRESALPAKIRKPTGQPWQWELFKLLLVVRSCAQELHEKLTEALLACEGHHDADH